MLNCFSRKSSISRNYSKTFSPAELSQQQIISIPNFFKDFFTCRIVLAANHQNPEKTQSLFRLQNCLSRKSSISRKYSKTFSPAELSQQQIISIPNFFKDFFTCRIVLAANHQYPEIIQRLFRRQNCLSRKSSISRKNSKTFSPAELSQRISSVSRKYPKRFSPAELSYQQIINIPEVFKYFFGCRIVLAANHHYPENIERLLCLQNCLSRKSSVSRKHSTFFRLQNCLSWKSSVSRNIQRLFRLHICLTRKSSITRNIQRLSCLQNCFSRKSSVSRKNPETFSPAEMSQPQIINIPKRLKNFFTCIIVLAASHQYPRNIQRHFSPAELSQPQIINIPKILKDLLAC